MKTEAVKKGKSYVCTCQRCGHVWNTVKDPETLKCPKCWFKHWRYKWGGPFLNGDKEDGRKNSRRWKKGESRHG